jgi:hypothetical protein
MDLLPLLSDLTAKCMSQLNSLAAHYDTVTKLVYLTAEALVERNLRLGETANLKLKLAGS